MVYIVTSCWYPSHVGPEIAKKYLEVFKKFPPSKAPGKAIIPVAVATGKKGIRILSITEVPDDDPQTFSDALNWAADNMAEYINIEGFEYKTRIWSSIQRAMEVIGMKAPAE
ncbi:MAG: hypothetical protein ACXAEX_20990 [Promethearchaeota archaeon]|jgi:hypothetical protein